MPNAEIVATGTELLLGEIVDTNTQLMARRLRELGIGLRHTCAVGDNETRIATAVADALGRADIVITSGGLGPTVDDVTREAVAWALGAELEFRPELWEQVKAAFQRFGREPADNNRRQAFIPEGATALPNPVGTAPAFWSERRGSIVICLPGVPHELAHFLEAEVVPLLSDRYPARSIIRVRVLHTAGIGESDLDARIGDLLRGSNPTVGLAAHPGQVDVRITARADTPDDADALLGSTECAVREALGRWIYGADDATLEQVVGSELRDRAWRIVVGESGIGGALVGCLGRLPEFAAGGVLPNDCSADDLDQELSRLRASCGAEVAIGALLRTRERETTGALTESTGALSSVTTGVFSSETAGDLATESTGTLIIETPAGRRRLERRFGGHPSHWPQRCATLALEALRRDLLRGSA